MATLPLVARNDQAAVGARNEDSTQKGDSGESQQAEPKANPEETKQPEHQKSHPDKSQ